MNSELDSENFFVNSYAFFLFAIYWLLPGHVEFSAFSGEMLGLSTVIFISGVWLICFGFSWRLKNPGFFASGFALLAAILLIIAQSMPESKSGLFVKYYDNADFSGKVERSQNYSSEEYTRVEPAIDFSGRGFDFFGQYFSMPFLNELDRRRWSKGPKPDYKNYPFSVELSGFIAIPPDVSEIFLSAEGGDAEIVFGGEKISANQFVSISPGIQSVVVRFARNKPEKIQLRLFWMTGNEQQVVPASAYYQQENPQTPWSSYLSDVSFILWGLAFILLVLRTRPMLKMSVNVYVWLVFVGVMLYFVLDIHKDGRSFDMQLFYPGSDWVLYETFARRILEGDWVQAGERGPVFMNFAYRYLMAGMHWLSGEPPANVLFLQRVVMAILIAVSFKIVNHFYGLKAAVALFVLMIASKSFLSMSGKLLDTTFGMAFSVAVLGCLLQYHREKATKWVVLAGLSLGSAMLIRANLLPMIVILSLWIYFIAGRSNKVLVFRHIALFVMISLSVFSLLGLRNYVVTGEWIFLPTNGLSNLWIGNHPPEYDGPTYYKTALPPRSQILPMVVEFIRAEPMAFIDRCWTKFLYILGIEQNGDVQIDVMLMWLLAVFGSIKMWLSSRLRVELSLLWLWVLVVNVPLVFIFPWGYGWRLSGPAFFPLFILGAYGLANWRERSVMVQNTLLGARR